MPNQENKSPLESSGMDIPDYAIERMARCLLPMMQKYYESVEGKKNWRLRISPKKSRAHSP